MLDLKTRLRKLVKSMLHRSAHVSFLERLVLSTIAVIVRPFLLDGPKRMAYLEYAQSRGLSVLPARYFEPVPDIAAVRKRLETVHLQIDDWRDTEIDHAVEAIISDETEVDRLKQRFKTILDNPMFNAVDIIACEQVVKRCMPRKIIEIGAGYSTRVFQSFAPDAEIVSIEPFPSDFLLSEANSNPKVRLIQTQIELFDGEALFVSLAPGDILFIDSTHVCNVANDLPRIFSGILPKIASGVVVHIHDVALPFEYPSSLVIGSGRLYNEQYVLAPLVAHGAYKPLFGSYRYLQRRGQWLRPDGDRFLTRGGSLWLEKA